MVCEHILHPKPGMCGCVTVRGGMTGRTGAHLRIMVIVAFLFSPWNGSDPVSISY